MNIQPKQRVKCLFRNGVVIEGIVQSWSKDEVELLSLGGEDRIVILHPNDDIVLIKIVLSDNSEELKPTEKPKLPKTELQQALDILVEKPTDTPGRIETIAELRIQLAEAEREIVANKLQEHHIGNPNGTKYASTFLVGKKRPLTASAIQNLKGKK